MNRIELYFLLLTNVSVSKSTIVNSGHLKSRHNSKPHTRDEKAERLDRDRPEPKVADKSHDLPVVQCKDTLLLDYDHNAQYSKRKLVSNADRYKELSDADDDSDENGQLSAADFQQLLSQPTSTGDHFTFAAERSWLQSADTDTSNDDSMASNLFKLNISNLNDGLIRVPFYLRHDLPTDLFIEDELTDIHYRSKYFENEKINQNPLPATTNQHLLDCFKSNTGQQVVVDKKAKPSVESKIEPLKNVDVQKFAETELVGLLQQTKVQEPTTNMASTATTSERSMSMVASTSAGKTATTPFTKTVQVKPTSHGLPKANVANTEDIQDWLDDILNE